MFGFEQSECEATGKNGSRYVKEKVKHRDLRLSQRMGEIFSNHMSNKKLFLKYIKNSPTQQQNKKTQTNLF